MLNCQLRVFKVSIKKASQSKQDILQKKVLRILLFPFDSFETLTLTKRRTLLAQPDCYYSTSCTRFNVSKILLG